MSRRLLAFIVTAGLAGCNGITPTAPAPAASGGTALTAASISILPSPAQLPTAGGISTLYVEVLSSGGLGVRDATVTFTTSTGQLTATTLRTDSTGHGTTEWSGDRTGRITASLGELTTSATIEVLGSQGPVPPGPGPGPGPPPPPPPPPPGPPRPPEPPPPPPGAPGDLVLTITPSLATPNASQSVTWTAAMSSSTGATVPYMDRFGWDLNGDGLVDRLEAAPSMTYPEGAYTAFLEVRTSDNRAVTATRLITVAPAPTLTATLSAVPSTTNIATPVTFTATVSSVGATGLVTSYGWDFTNDGTIDHTTAGNTTTKVYNDATLGAKTARVVATSANGQTGTATTIVTLSEPAIVVDLSVLPAGTQPAGTLLTITATVTSAGNVPASMTFAWDYNNDGTIDETTTGSSPRPVGHTYNASGSQTVKVTVTSPDGRTAANTRVIPVS